MICNSYPVRACPVKVDIVTTEGSGFTVQLKHVDDQLEGLQFKWDLGVFVRSYRILEYPFSGHI
jgi:hypothetical protein